MISLALLAFVVSLVTTLWVRRLFVRHAASYADDAPQRFHRGVTPRMGGLGLLAGWALALAALPLLQRAHLAGNVDSVRLNLQLTSPRRAADKLKFLAGSEAAMGAWIGDVPPEVAAEKLRTAVEGVTL